jgi:hypothetical protein
MDWLALAHQARGSGSEPAWFSGIVFSYEMKDFASVQHPLYVLDTCYSDGGLTRARRSFLCSDLDAESRTFYTH